MEKEPEVGQKVVYIDTRRKRHDALVTNVFSSTCINLLYVSSDEKQSDDYGRQIVRESSCVHGSLNDADANCWVL